MKMAETSSDSESDSVPEEERLQQKLLQVTKNKWNNPESISTLKKTNSNSTSESSDDENSKLYANNTNKEMDLITTNFEALKAKVKQSVSVTNKSKPLKGKFSLQLKKSSDDEDTDDSEKIANTMKNTMKQSSATKLQTPDSNSDTDSDECTKNGKGNPAKTVPLRTSTPNFPSKFIQAANLSTKKDLLHKILADFNDPVNFIPKNDNSTPTTKPKSILKHSAQKNQPNYDDSDSDKNSLPLNQEGFKSKNVSSDSDTSFANVISSTQIVKKHSQTPDGNSEKLSQNDSSKKRLSFSKVISIQKAISPDLARKTESSGSEESELETNKIMPEDSSSSSESEDDSNMTSKHKSTVITKVFTPKSSKKSPSKVNKDDLPSDLKGKIKKTIVSPKKLLSVRNSSGSENDSKKSITHNNKIASPKKSEPDSSENSDSEDDVPNNMQKQINTNLNSSKTKIAPKLTDLSDSDDFVTPKSNDRLKNQNIITKVKQEPSSDSDSDSEEEKITNSQNTVPKSNIPLNSSKIPLESSSDSSDSEMEQTNTPTSKMTNTIINSPPKPQSKNTQESSSDSSESETETTKASESEKKSSSQRISPKSNIQVNNLKNTQDSSSDSSESEAETTKAPETEKKTSPQRISPKSNIQVNNLKNSQDSSSDSSESETETKTTKALETKKKSSSQRISPKSSIQMNNLKNTQDSSSDSSESDTETTKPTTKSNIQVNKLKNTQESSSESSDSETEAKTINNLRAKNRKNSFVTETQLDIVKSQHMLKHNKILNDICSANSSNESSSSGGKKKKELPKTKMSCIKRVETVSTSDSSDDEPNANKPDRLKERIQTLCDVQVVDTAPILEKQQVSGMYDSLKEFALTHPNLQALDAKTNLLLDDLDDDVEIWLTQCPKSLVPSLLLGQTLNLDKNAKLKLKVNDTKYEYVSQRTDVLNLCLIGSESAKNPKLSAKIIKPVGTLIIQQALKEKKAIHFKKQEHVNIAPPAHLKLRHPIFGSNFKDKLDLDNGVQQKLLEAEIARRKLEQKAEKKKQRALNAKSEKKMDEHTNKDEIIFQLLNQTKNVTTEEHLEKKKSRKRKMSDIEVEGESSSKIPKVEVDSPVKLTTKNKRKPAENVQNAKKELNDSQNTLIENIVQPTLPVKIKKKKNHEVLTQDGKSNSISNPSIADPKITLLENIAQTSVISNDKNAPIKHKSKKNKQQKTLNVETTFTNQNITLESKTDDPTTTDAPVKIKKMKKSQEINAPKEALIENILKSTLKELKVNEQHKIKHKKNAKEKLNLDDSPQKIHKQETNDSFDNNSVSKKKPKKIKENELQNVPNTDLNASTSNIKKDKHKNKSMSEEIVKEEVEMSDFSPKKERKKKNKDASMNITDSSKKKNKKRDSEIIDKEKIIQELLSPIVQSTWVEKKSKKRKHATSIDEVLNIENAQVKKKKKSKK